MQYIFVNFVLAINETQKIEDELLVELNNTKKEKNKRENQLIRGFENQVLVCLNISKASC